MGEVLKRIGVTEILGKEIEFYGTWEEPLFNSKSVADWLEERDGYTVARKVDEEEKQIHTICVGGQNREVTMFTEDGLYECLMQSRKPIAKDLKKKVKQYLKQIRLTGGAVEENREEEFINKYFPSFSDDVKLSMVQDLLKTNKELKPKAEYHDKVLNNSLNKTTTDIAKDLSMSAQKLNKILHELNIIYPKKVKDKIKGWYLKAEYDKLVPDFADYRINEYGQSLVWTEKGRKWIIEQLENNKLI